MKMPLKGIALSVSVVFFLMSCAAMPPKGTVLTAEQRSKAQKQCIARYTVGGAIGGALLGALIGGKKGEGALIGAAAGGTLAFAVAYGRCLSVYSDLVSYPAAGAEETARKVGYTPSAGYVTKIENFAVNPVGVPPGGRVQMNGSYYVMAPEGSKEVKVTETRSLSYLDPSVNQWKTLGSVDQEITSGLGTRRAEGNIDLPPDVPEGRYLINFRVAANGMQDETSQELMVQKGLAKSEAVH
jgi:hypothetical protein